MNDCTYILHAGVMIDDEGRGRGFGFFAAFY